MRLFDSCLNISVKVSTITWVKTLSSLMLIRSHDVSVTFLIDGMIRQSVWPETQFSLTPEESQVSVNRDERRFLFWFDQITLKVRQPLKFKGHWRVVIILFVQRAFQERSMNGTNTLSKSGNQVNHRKITRSLKAIACRSIVLRIEVHHDY